MAAVVTTDAANRCRDLRGSVCVAGAIQADEAERADGDSDQPAAQAPGAGPLRRVAWERLTLPLRRLGQRPIDRQPLLASRHVHRVALLHRALQDQPGERILQAALD